MITVEISVNTWNMPNTQVGPAIPHQISIFYASDISNMDALIIRRFFTASKMLHIGITSTQVLGAPQ